MNDVNGQHHSGPAVRTTAAPADPPATAVDPPATDPEPGGALPGPRSTPPRPPVPAQQGPGFTALQRRRREDLLDGVGRWGVMHTRHGDFRLRPVRLATDLPLLVEWMNDPVVSVFWELGGASELTEHHLRAQLEGDGRSVPCLGLLDGTPMSYWELYRADLDPLARHYPARPHDTGIHLLIGPAEQRGRGVGGTLIAALARRALRERHQAHRIVAEPDVRNLPSVRAFLRAGFRYDSELLLPEKHAALMVYERG